MSYLEWYVHGLIRGSLDNDGRWVKNGSAGAWWQDIFFWCLFLFASCRYCIDTPLGDGSILVIQAPGASHPPDTFGAILRFLALIGPNHHKREQQANDPKQCSLHRSEAWRGVPYYLLRKTPPQSLNFQVAIWITSRNGWEKCTSIFYRQKRNCTLLKTSEPFLNMELASIHISIN